MQRNFGHIAAIASSMRDAVQKADWNECRPVAARRLVAPPGQPAGHIHSAHRPADHPGASAPDRWAPKSAARAEAAASFFWWSAAHRSAWRALSPAPAPKSCPCKWPRAVSQFERAPAKGPRAGIEEFDGSAAIGNSGPAGGRGSTWRRSKSPPSRRRIWIPSRFWAILDRIASGIGARLPSSASGREFVRVANEYLFGDLGFRGNEIDYNDPRNSCLNYVLDRRTGIPIALSVVYIEVARRLGQPVSGVGLPGPLHRRI